MKQAALRYMRPLNCTMYATDCLSVYIVLKFVNYLFDVKTLLPRQAYVGILISTLVVSFTFHLINFYTRSYRRILKLWQMRGHQYIR